MRNLVKTLFTIAALLVGSVAHAQNGVATFSWVAPTQRVDNTALPASDIVSYTITSTYCQGTAPNYTMGTTVLGTTTVAGNLTAFTKSDLTIDSGTQAHCFTLTTVAKQYTTVSGVTTQSGTVSSDPSAVVWKKITAPGTTPAPTAISAKPDPATGFAVK